MNSKDRQTYQWKNMTMGTCYYPEHWEPSLWPQDLERMLEAGITVIRIAEFAWNKIEPREGVFTFDFFDEFLDLCDQKGMRVIFGTPTATPPAWLTEKYPEVLNATKDGVLYRHGGRRHYNYNSPIYQKLSARIVEKEAEHYGHHPAIVGWQIDNELNCELSEFYSEADSKAFRAFLQKTYGTLERLNEAWGTAFWNQTYMDWQEVYVPRTVSNMGINPHQHLDYFRFLSDSTIRYCKLQAEIIRKYKKPGDFITTNGMFPNVDNHRMEKDCLDVYTYDSYPNFAFGLDRDPTTADDLNDRKWSMHLNEVRSICPHFGIMEQQSGANGWTTRMEAPAPRPGQLTLWAMQSVAHGADFISFFRWRTCTIGTEIYWHGILDYDNRDNRKLEEVKNFHQKLQTLETVCGADHMAAFALVKDYDNVWDAQVDAWHQRVARASEKEIFVASELSHTPYDVVYLQEDSQLSDLAAYPVLIYPHPTLIDEKRAALLRAYVEQGGTLLIGCRAGYKDMNGHCVMMPQPGLLQELAGSDIRDFTFASPVQEPMVADFEGEIMDMPIFHDILTPLEGSKVLATYKNCSSAGGEESSNENSCAARKTSLYGNCYYAGEAAVIEKRTGAGRTIHFGSTFTRKNLKPLFQYLGIWEPFRQWIEAPETVEVVMRKKDNRRYLFVLNFQPYEVSYELKKQAKLLYTGETLMGTCTLPAYGTAVYEIPS